MRRSLVSCQGEELLMLSFLVRQLQEKHWEENRLLHLAFVDAGKGLIWCSLQKLAVDEWPVRTAKALHRNAVGKVKVSNECNNKFGARVEEFTNTSQELLESEQLDKVQKFITFVANNGPLTQIEGQTEWSPCTDNYAT